MIRVRGAEYHCSLCGKVQFIANRYNGAGERLISYSRWIIGEWAKENVIENPEIAICPDCIEKIGFKTDE